ncbi:MAG: alpha-L-rhamnosidase C-terminal domain-containing protein [Rikenellaceae bacterium]
MRKLLTLLLLAICSTLGALGQGQWITHPDFAHSPNQWFELRRSFDLDSPSDSRVECRVSCDSKYWLYVNGELVVFEGGLKRGPNAQDSYVDRVDIAPYLRAGQNTVAILMWYFGREGFSHKDSGVAGLFFESPLLVSDQNWKIRVSSAYGSTGDPQANYRLAESNVRYDARCEESDWMLGEYDDSRWAWAQCVGKEGDSPWNALCDREIPQFRYSDVVSTSDFVRSGDTIILQLPYNMQYHPYIEVDAPEGLTVRFDPDNLYTLNDVPLRGEYITHQGRQSYLHLPWMSGHNILFIVDPEVEVTRVGYVESGYDTEFCGTFEIDDPQIMRYFDKAQRTLYVNMRDTYFDCPDRERAQWIGDGVILSEESSYLLDQRAALLTQKFYRELFGWQRSDSTLFGPVPAGNWSNELPQQILAAVGSYGIGLYYMNSGDRAMVEYAYEHIKRYLELWKVEADGTVPFRYGGWTWGDWGDQIDRQLAEHIWYYIALDNFANFSDLLGHTTQGELARAKMASIKDRLNREFWTPRGYMTPGLTTEIDDRGNALAVVAGIASSDKYPVLLKLFSEVEHASPYMEKYVMEALFLMGEGEFAIERFKRRYAQMIDHPSCTTLWEFWYYGDSVNHAWSGGPLSVFFKNIAGIKPLAAGYREFSLFFDLIGKESLSCSMLSVRGQISLDVNLSGGVTTIKAQVPEGSTAIIRVPVSAKNLKMNVSAQQRESDNQYHYYAIPQGECQIEYTN